MRYEGKLYRPPSEADSFIVQATIGCSYNHCTYCDMYREKQFRVRALDDTLADLDAAGSAFGADVQKLFVADGDALMLPTDHWLAILERAKKNFPNLRRASCYAMARNILEKTDAELRALSDAGLKILYVGPESGDDVTLKRIAKGDDFAEHVLAAERAHAAEMELSVIVLLGIAMERSAEHAARTAELITKMDPEYFAALTVTVVPGTPLAKLHAKGRFAVPEVDGLLRELRAIVDAARPTDALFRTNHASNYLPLGGRLPRDRERIVSLIYRALAGEIALRPEWSRGL
jgi:radical SAM superfamily enzyme YgiQ (UPF0313 family)